jgi:hypothetical protein
MSYVNWSGSRRSHDDQEALIRKFESISIGMSRTNIHVSGGPAFLFLSNNHFIEIATFSIYGLHYNIPGIYDPPETAYHHLSHSVRRSMLGASFTFLRGTGSVFDGNLVDARRPDDWKPSFDSAPASEARQEKWQITPCEFTPVPELASWTDRFFAWIRFFMMPDLCYTIQGKDVTSDRNRPLSAASAIHRHFIRRCARLGYEYAARSFCKRLCIERFRFFPEERLNGENLDYEDDGYFDGPDAAQAIDVLSDEEFMKAFRDMDEL